MAVGSTEEEWGASQRVGYICQYLGLQDVPQKRRMVGQDRGLRRGTKFHILDGSIYHMTGEGKWAKTRLIIKKWLQRVALEEPLDYNELQSDRGLLNYLLDTYRSCRQSMKGMHLTLDSWHPNGYPEGWKHDPYGLDNDLSEDNLGGEAEEALGQITGMPSKGASEGKGELKTFRSVQRWFYDFQVLEQLTRDKYPPLQPLCPP